MILAVRVLYNLLLPLFCVLAAPAWILRMARRGGLSSHLWERLGAYDRSVELEPTGGVYVHAVSVGETMTALKLIAGWLKEDPDETFVLAVTTSTGYQLAGERAPEGVRVIYSPVDFPFLVTRLLARFEPRLIVLVDSELWPNLLAGADRAGVPTALVNARLSPRSARRYAKFKAVTAPILGQLKLVCAQVQEHARLWKEIGVGEEAVVVTGSVKFDQEGGPLAKQRPEFTAMLNAFGAGRPVVLGASTHAGEEVLIARAASSRAGVLPVLLPRHAERRREVKEELERAGFEVILRSAFEKPRELERAVLVVDSTGEMREWMAHADLVVIGKSLRARGGQNPTEAIAARVPVVCGEHMENFEPLISELRAANGVTTVRGEEDLREAVGKLLDGTRERSAIVQGASAVLEGHRGAAARTVKLLRSLAPR